MQPKRQRPGTFDILAACLASARQQARTTRELRLIDWIARELADDLAHTHDRFLPESFLRQAKYQHNVPLEE